MDSTCYVNNVVETRMGIYGVNTLFDFRDTEV